MLSRGGPLGADVVETKTKKRKKKGGGPATAEEADSTETPSPVPTNNTPGGSKKAQKKGGSKQQSDATEEAQPAAATARPEAPKRPLAVAPVPLEQHELTPAALAWDFQQGGAPSTACGVTNASNFCFMAAVLQSLTHCAPFADACVQMALREKQQAAGNGGSQAPKTTASTLGAWMINYWKSKTSVAPPRLALTLDKKRPNQSLGATQEDAQEFLLQLLSVIDEEVAAKAEEEAAKSGGSEFPSRPHTPQASAGSKAGTPTPSPASQHQQSNAGGGKGWVTVGKGKQRLVVREHQDPTPTSSGAGTPAIIPGATVMQSIFAGKFHSHVKGAKGNAKGITSVTVQPFWILPVDLSDGDTIEEALRGVRKNDIIEGSSDEIIRKEVAIGALPPVLIIQLRRWAFTREGELLKLDNRMEFGTSLNVPKEVCDAARGVGSGGITNKQRSYNLSSVICHRGSRTGAGHYVTYLAEPEVVDRALAGRKLADAPAGKAARPAASPPLLLCNDSRLTVSSLDAAIDDTPYLLVWTRQ